MQELMARQGMGKQGNQQNPEQEKQQEDAKREADERRQMMLSQVLSSQARERSKSHLKMCWSSSSYSPFLLHYVIIISFMFLFLSFFR